MSWDYRSPLRYPGAKTKIAKELKIIMQNYSLKHHIFVEPCCGGASASLSLLANNLVENVILGDLDPWVASFWRVLFFNTEALVDRIKNAEITIEHWKSLRETPPKTEEEKAFYCLYFNRTSYSGIITGGPLGGYKQESKYTIDCRFNRDDLIRRIRLIAHSFRSRIVAVREISIFDLLEEPRFGEYAYYIDPPYVVKGKRLYHKYFTLEDHRRLAQLLSVADIPWILSYDDDPLIRDLYFGNGYNHRHIEIDHEIVKHKKGNELLIWHMPGRPAERKTLFDI